MSHHNADDSLIIRQARTVDSDEIRRLAVLDSAPVPGGDLVVAERAGRLIAAVPVGGGAPIADPFERTAAVVEMLSIRAAQLSDAPPAQPSRLQRIEALFERPAVRVN